MTFDEAVPGDPFLEALVPGPDAAVDGLDGLQLPQRLRQLPVPLPLVAQTAPQPRVGRGVGAGGSGEQGGQGGQEWGGGERQGGEEWGGGEEKL